jgi:polyisoprenoid-binding protein YceI
MSKEYARAADFSTAQDTPLSDGIPGFRPTYHIDPVASRIEFSIRKRLFIVKHMVVTGHFADVKGTISLDKQEPSNSRAEVTIGTASLSTLTGSGRLDLAQAQKRDQHLRKADFFDVEHYPQLTFKSRDIEAADRAAGRYRVTGDLTVRRVTREVTLDAVYVPATVPPSLGVPRTAQ